MIAALAVDMENEYEPDPDELAKRRHRDRFLKTLADEPDFADAAMAIMTYGGRGEIQLKFVSGGHLDEIKIVLSKRVR